MDEAIENARAAQGLENFDDSCLTDLRVKQKYMGHRNARWDITILFENFSLYFNTLRM